MTTFSKNILDPALDVSGSINHSTSLDVTDEVDKLGSTISGQNGSSAIIYNITDDIVTISGLSGFTDNDVGKFIEITNSANINNNGLFIIDSIISSNIINIINNSAVYPDTNSGTIDWVERNPYSLEDDLNYIRTDRQNIKGVNYYDLIPTYQRPNNIGTNINTNLNNISGKTTDAVSYFVTNLFYSTAIIGNSKITITSLGNLKHSNSIDNIGIPLFDSAPFNGNYTSCYVEIINRYIGTNFTVLSGIHMGEKIFGVTNSGISVSPNSVEIIFYSCPIGGDIATESTLYSWEVSQALNLSLKYGYNQRLDQLNKSAFRENPITNIFSSGGINSSQHDSLRQLIHFINEGPGNGFNSGAFKEIIGQPFPISIIWYIDSSKVDKIVEKLIIRNDNNIPISITWNIYDTDGSTILNSITDTIVYASNIFESNRTRTIS